VVRGCCGLAGDWGMVRGHHAVSVAVAEARLLPAVRDLDDAGVVCADGFSCRTQVADLAGRPARHLAEVLDDACTGTGRPTPPTEDPTSGDGAGLSRP
jgi:Fe-S oxidoreductase